MGAAINGESVGDSTSYVAPNGKTVERQDHGHEALQG